LGRALLNLADAVTGTDPAAAKAAQAAAAHLRRADDRNLLALAVVNLAQALLMTGDRARRRGQPVIPYPAPTAGTVPTERAQ